MSTVFVIVVVSSTNLIFVVKQTPVLMQPSALGRPLKRLVLLTWALVTPHGSWVLIVCSIRRQIFKKYNTVSAHSLFH